ncbi:hypothetical protein CI109_104219 [Kwoniella shandongensis]|uniref:RRM domain-containing protein n=1 Tax=Kwoniella shandongensis TaxID=1734106 RepID=A0AAJ8LM47_9TREE
MSYAYSNPYQRPQPAFGLPAASTSAVRSEARQVLFTGLPLDIGENDLRELLLADPLRLSPITTSVTCFCGPDGRFIGVALVYVASDIDAEKIRREYSAYTISVHHVLHSTQSLPLAAPTGPAAGPRTAQPPTKPKGKSVAAAPATNDKPLGLKLLARLNKPGQVKDKQQLALLEKQKANLSKNGKSGAALLSRLQGAPGTHAAKTKPKPKQLASGAAKVGRAKANTNKNAMEVDKPVQAKKEKPKPKTQADLDEEMRAYERARRFAA